MLTQLLQPVTAGLTSAVPLLEQTAQISEGSGKVLPGERLSQAWALLMACLQLFPAVGTVWVPVTATGAIRTLCSSVIVQFCLCLLVQVETRMDVAVLEAAGITCRQRFSLGALNLLG